MLSLIPIIIGLGLTTNAFAENILVPTWVKNTAGWWADDKISETEFANAIEFLVNEGIIQTTVTYTDEKTSRTYNSIDEIINDKTLSYREAVLEVDKLFPYITGYRGATFDGEAVYFAPYYNNHGRHAFMVKFDISKPFDNPNSWDAVNMAQDDPKSPQQHDLVGFQGALYNNQYVYFIPYFIDENELGSKILRYNTESDFHNKKSWDWAGYFPSFEGGVVEKNFVYFSPHLDEKNKRSAVPVQYDTTKDFHDPNAWKMVRTQISASYIGAASDGEKIYYAPYIEDNAYGIQITDKSTLLIYDTNKPFLERNSWETRSIPYGHYAGAGFNGTHIVFAPFCNSISKEHIEDCSRVMFLEKNSQEINYSKKINSAYSGVIETDNALYLVPRINNENIRSDFIQIKNSIETFSPNIGLGGYWGGTYDGRFVYFSPYDTPNSDVKNGEFLRYDTLQPFNNSDSWESISLAMTDFRFDYKEESPNK